MSPQRFEHLLTLVGPLIVKQPCRSRKVIDPAERLMLTLRYLATGEDQQTQSFYFRIGRSTVSNIIHTTLQAIWIALNKAYLSAPSKTEEWIKIAKGFEEEWNFPHCLGAIDGKHIMMECPINGGSAFYNYKGFHSIVLLAVCDANYCFTFVDIGAYGGTNDASVFSNTSFGEAFDKQSTELNIPRQSKFGQQILPYVLVGDDIFPLKNWLMKPYPGRNLNEPERIYNYRLSRARRTIENTFGILAAKWRIFRRPIKAVNIQLVDSVTKAAVCLHNYLRLTENAKYLPTGFVDCESDDGTIIPGDWRTITGNDNGLVHIERIGGNRHTFEAGHVRNFFKDHFNNEGSVPWQYNHVRSCGHVRQGCHDQ